MAWKQSAYTKLGAEILAETLTGRKLTIDEAVTGTGTVTEEELGNAIDVLGERRTVDLMGIEDIETEDGGAKKIGIRITNKGVEMTGKIHQVGVFGHMDSDAEKKLIFIMQDESGIEIPSEIENMDFELDLNVVLAISNKANITVNVTAGNQASVEQVKDFVQKHNEDLNAHVTIIEQAVEKAVEKASEEIGAIIQELTVPAESWTLDESLTPDSETDGTMPVYPYYADVVVEQAQAVHFPSAALHKEALEAASTAGVAPVMQALDGKVRFWAKEPAREVLNVSLALLSSGKGSAGGGYGIVNVGNTLRINVPGGVVGVGEDGKIPEFLIPDIGGGFVEMA